MRPQALLLAGLTVAVMLGLWGFSRGLSWKQEVAPGVHGLVSSEDGVASPAAELSGLGEVEGDAGTLRANGPSLPLTRDIGVVSNRNHSGPIALRALDPEGGALLGSGGSLPEAEQAYAWVVMGEGTPPGPASALDGRLFERVSLERPGRTQRSVGWLGSVDGPERDAFVALMYGDRVVVAEAMDAAAGEVVLRAGLADFDALSASVSGSLRGPVEAASLVRLVPLGRTHVSRVLTPRGQGEAFHARGLPPGPLTVRVRGEAAAIGPAIFALKEAEGLGAVSIGRRVPDRQQWDLRLSALARLQFPVADVDLMLAPGEAVDLGYLSAPSAAAVVLELAGPRGQPLDAAGVSVDVLSLSDAQGPAVQTWLFKNSVCVYPLAPGPLELIVASGDDGALVQVRADSLAIGRVPAAVPVRLEPLSVVRLFGGEPESEGGAVKLLTARGRVVRADRRWEGSRYGGHLIGPGVRIVPAGSYVLAPAMGARRPFTLGKGEFLDLTDGAAGVAVKLERSAPSPLADPGGAH